MPPPASHLNLPKTTVYRGLSSLSEAGWLESDPSDPTRWVVSARAFVIGSTVSNRVGLRSQALPFMNELAAETEETIHLTIRDGDTVLLIERIDCPHPVRTFTPLGARAPLHASSNGKAILACLPPEEIDRYLAGGLEALTARTITDREILADELRLIRKRGYAVSNEEQQVGVVSIAAAIRPHGGEPAGALSISGPKSRMTRNIHSDHGDKVRSMAGRIAASLPAGATA